MPQNPNFKHLISKIEKSVAQQVTTVPHKIENLYKALPESTKHKVISLGIAEMQNKK